MFWKIQDRKEITNIDNTQTKLDPEKAKQGKIQQNKSTLV